MKTGLNLLAAGVLGALLPLAAAGEEALPYCEYQEAFPPRFEAAGGAQSWSVRHLVQFEIAEGVTAEFRSIDPYWGGEDFSRYGDAVLSYSSKGDVVFRSHYPVTTGDPRAGVDKVLEAEGKALFLVLRAPGSETPEVLARLIAQQAEYNIDLFALVQGEQAARLSALTEAGADYELLLGTDGILIASTTAISFDGYEAARDWGKAQFEKVQADVANGVCK